MNLTLAWKKTIAFLKKHWHKMKGVCVVKEEDSNFKYQIRRKFARMKNVSDIAEQFKVSYDKLVSEEDHIRELMTSYCTGGNARMADIDQSYIRMKRHMKDIRKLAERAEQQKEGDETED